MHDSELIKQNPLPYIPIPKFDKNSILVENFSKLQKLKEKMHYNSNRFQIQALLILSFSIFMFGVQDITEDYLFMSPAFKCKTESHGISIF